MRGVAALLGLLAAACGGAPDVAEPAAPDLLADGQVAGVVRAFNDGEIDRGHLAAARGQEPAVRELGRRRVDQHRRDNATLLEVLGAHGLAFADSELRQGALLLSRDVDGELWAASQDDFDVAYLHAQVLMAQDLAVLLAVLAGEAEAEALRSHLQACLVDWQALLDDACEVWRGLASETACDR